MRQMKGGSTSRFFLVPGLDYFWTASLWTSCGAIWPINLPPGPPEQMKTGGSFPHWKRWRPADKGLTGRGGLAKWWKTNAAQRQCLEGPNKSAARRHLSRWCVMRLLVSAPARRRFHAAICRRLCRKRAVIAVSAPEERTVEKSQEVLECEAAQPSEGPWVCSRFLQHHSPCPGTRELVPHHRNLTGEEMVNAFELLFGYFFFMLEKSTRPWGGRADPEKQNFCLLWSLTLRSEFVTWLKRGRKSAIFLETLLKMRTRWKRG